MQKVFIDTNGSKKHVRHSGKIIRVETEPGRFGDQVVTDCNRKIASYWRAENVSYFYDTSARYSKPCKKCLPADHAAMIANGSENQKNREAQYNEL